MAEVLPQADYKLRVYDQDGDENIYTSPDGINWTVRDGNSNNYRNIVWVW